MCRAAEKREQDRTKVGRKRWRKNLARVIAAAKKASNLHGVC